MLAADQATSKALQRVDDAAKGGHADQALDILKRSATSAADEASSAASKLEPRTAWGRTEKGALVALTTDRKREMATYEHALGGSDEDMLAALTAQVDIEKRAAAISSDLERGP